MHKAIVGKEVSGFVGNIAFDETSKEVSLKAGAAWNQVCGRKRTIDFEEKWVKITLAGSQCRV